jgi:hypothetical protein
VLISNEIAMTARVMDRAEDAGRKRANDGKETTATMSPRRHSDFLRKGISAKGT